MITGKKVTVSIDLLVKYSHLDVRSLGALQPLLLIIQYVALVLSFNGMW